MASTIFMVTEFEGKTIGEREGKERFEWVLSNISNAERQQVLKFITGRARLQPGVEQYVLMKARTTDEELPKAVTCSNELLIDMYSSGEVMRDKLMIAVRLCGEIDDDGDSVDNEANFQVEQSNIQSALGGSTIRDLPLGKVSTIEREDERSMAAIMVSLVGGKIVEKVANDATQKQSSDTAAEAMFDF